MVVVGVVVECATSGGGDGSGGPISGIVLA